MARVQASFSEQEVERLPTCKREGKRAKCDESFGVGGLQRSERAGEGRGGCRYLVTWRKDTFVDHESSRYNRRYEMPYQFIMNSYETVVQTR